MECMLSVLRRKSTAVDVWVGLLARRCRACVCGCFTFPGRWPSGRSKRASSLTVAGPRRIRTGLPCYAPRGHPDRDRFHTISDMAPSRARSASCQAAKSWRPYADGRVPTARPTGRTGECRLEVRFDVTLALHALEGDVDGAALERPARAIAPGAAGTAPRPAGESGSAARSPPAAAIRELMTAGLDPMGASQIEAP